MRIGFFVSASLPGDPTLADIVAGIERAEADGLDTVWASGRYDALIQLAVAAGTTRRIELGTAVVHTYPRHPSALAAQALTIQHASAGRLTLGIAPGHKDQMEDRLGLDWSRPVAHTREYLTCLRRLLAGEQVDFAGDDYHLTGYASPVPATTAPSVLVAALKPRMLQVAGELADGTIAWFVGPDYLRRTLVPAIEAAAHGASRPQPRVVVGVPIWVTDHTDQARQQLEQAHLGVLTRRPVFRSLLDAQGALGAAAVSLVGDEATVSAGLAAYAAAGASDVAASIVADSAEEYERTYQLLVKLAADPGSP